MGSVSCAQSGSRRRLGTCQEYAQRQRRTAIPHRVAELHRRSRRRCRKSAAGRTLHRIFRFRLRDIRRRNGHADLVIESFPPWWTPRKLVAAIAILMTLLLAILVWNVSLRRVSERRGRERADECLARGQRRTPTASRHCGSAAEILPGRVSQLPLGLAQPGAGELNG